MNNLNLSGLDPSPQPNLNPTSIVRRTIYPNQNLFNQNMNTFHNLLLLQQQPLQRPLLQRPLLPRPPLPPSQYQSQQQQQQFSNGNLPRLSNLSTLQQQQQTQPNNIHQRPEFYNSFNQQKNRDLILLENFICELPNSTNFYCNACCLELPTKLVDDHLRKSKHLSSKKKLNNQLLAVNLFQISKHYDQQLTSFLEKNFLNYELEKNTKISDFEEFKNFLHQNLTIKFKLTLIGSIPNDCLIHSSDININIELLEDDAKKEENREILKLIKNLVAQKYSNRLEILKITNLDRFERAYFLTKNRNIINLINISNCKHSDLIGQYVRFDERVIKLMYNIRFWANYCDLDQPLKASYRPALIQIMVIYFLQHCKTPVLPNFHFLLNKNGDYTFGESDNHRQHIEPITDDDLIEIKSKWKTTNCQTLGELWIDFFKFYLFIFDHEKNFVNITHNCKEKTSKAFSVCNVTDGSVFSVIFNWRIHYERLNKLFFEIYKHSCFFHYPNISSDNLDTQLQFIISLDNFKKDFDFRMTMINKDEKRGNRNQKVQYDIKQLWLLSVKFNFKVCLKQFELDKLQSKKKNFNIKINKSIGYQELPRYCVLCKAKNHFVKNCHNMELPILNKLDKDTISKCALVITYIGEKYYRVKTLNENIKFLDLIDQVKRKLDSYIQSVYEDSRLQLYGSILNGFGHTESDLDFALLFREDENKDDDEIQFNRKKMVKKIGYSAFKQKDDIEDLQVITNARVPILKLKFKTDTRTFDCDISIENRLPFYNTHLLRLYCTIDSRVPKIGLLIKKFARICQICFANQGGLKSYAFNVMIIYFLQQCDPPVLPVLQELEQEKLESEIVNGWEVKYFQDLDRIEEVWPSSRTNQKSIGELFIEFFIFYTEKFDYDKNVISIKQSRILTKYEKKWGSPIAIEDPFLLTHNLSDALEMSMINYIRSCFILARNHFTTFASNTFKPSTTINNLYDIVFDATSLRNADLLPFGKGCQVCFKIGHKKANCPELRSGLTPSKYRLQFNERTDRDDDEVLPAEFNLDLADISRQDIQFLSLIEQFGNKLKFRH